MEELESPLELSALLTSLKDSVIGSTELLTNMVDNDIKELELTENTSKEIVALLMYDMLVKKDSFYSYLDDFNFTKEGKIILKNTNKEQVKKNLEFMQKYLMYRIEYPIDLASC